MRYVSARRHAGARSARRLEIAESRLRRDLAVIRDGSIILAVYVFFASFVYIRMFYGHFGVAVTELEIPFNQLPVYAYNVLATPWVLTVALFVGGVLAIGHWKLKRAWLIRTLEFVIAVSLFPALYLAASEVAAENASATRLGKYLKTVTFVLDSKHGHLYPPAFLNANNDERLWLLVSTERSYIALEQPEQEEVGLLPMASVYEVPRAHVVLVTVQVPDATWDGVRR